MASAYRRRSDGAIYIKYRNAEGRYVAERTKCRTRGEGREEAIDMERRAERIRRGLEAPPQLGEKWTVAQLLTWYRETHLNGKPSDGACKHAIDEYIAPAIGSILVPKLLDSDIEAMLEKLAKPAGPLGPQMINHLRGYVSRAYNRAHKKRIWRGENPAAAVATVRVPRKVYDYLHPDEVPQFLGALAPWWRRWYSVRLLTGMRRGELAALRRSSVDKPGRKIAVKASYERDTTKGGHSDWLPLAEELVPILDEQIRAANAVLPDDLVFPDWAGRPIGRDFKEASVFRRALVKARLVTGYTHKCRRKGCGETIKAADDELRRCKNCNMKLWPVAHPRAIRPYDTRATFLSLLAQAGVAPALVRDLARHEGSWEEITAKHYIRFDGGLQAAAINSLRLLGPPPPAPPERAAASAEPPAPSQGAPAVRMADREGTPPKGSGEALPEVVLSGLEMERATGLEPVTPSLGILEGPSPPGPDPTQHSSFRDVRDPSHSSSFTPTPAVPAVRARFGTPEARRLVPIDGGRDDLLTVADVCKRLRLSSKTVYEKLLVAGELPHHRVRNNAIRIHPDDLTAYLARSRRT